MKKYLYSFLIIYLVVFIVGCNYNEKPRSHNTGDCIINKDSTFESSFYPFKETKYKTSEIIKYFKQGVKIDSGSYEFNIGDTIFYYKYYDDYSQYKFLFDRYNRETINFNMNYFTVSSAFIEFRNGVKYNMTRKDFFDAIKSEEVTCDTIQIYERYKGYYFMFIFKNDTLKQISEELIAM